MKLALFALLLPAAWAQEYEFGGIFGYGFYRDATVFSPNGDATAGIRNRFAAGVVVGQNLYEYISGEVRYLYQDGDPFVTSGPVRGNVNGQSHAFDYSLLFHARPREAKLQPFFELGAGAKYYRVNGPAPQPQPLPNVVTLTSESQWRFLTTVGVGVKYRWKEHVLLRADFRDYITPFPKSIFVQAQGGTDRGLFEQFTPSVGISYLF
jgi:Outer membrane protein beta-barrel domain